MLDCFMPVWDLVILLPSQICGFLFHLFVLFSQWASGRWGAHSRYSALLLVRVGEGAGEQDRRYPPRKGRWPKPPQSGTCRRCYGPEQLLTFQHFNTTLPLSCVQFLRQYYCSVVGFLFLVLLTVLPTAYVQNPLLVLSLFLCFSTRVCDSPRICHAVSQSPVVCSQLLAVPGDCHWCAACFSFQVINE